MERVVVLAACAMGPQNNEESHERFLETTELDVRLVAVDPGVSCDRAVPSQ